MGERNQQSSNNHDRVQAAANLILTIIVAIIVLGLAIRVGAGLFAAVEPEQAEAAAEETATPVVTEVVPGVTLEPTEVSPTAVPPTATPAPTATPSSATLEPTPVPPTPMPTSVSPTPVVPRLVAGESGVNIRRGPGTGYDKVGFLDPGNEALITGWSGAWWRIEVEGQAAYVSGDYVTALDADAVPEVAATELPGPTVGNPVFEPAPIWAIDEPRWIDVDLSEQRVTAYEGQTPVKSYLVSTGLPGTPTPEGQFRIWVKFRYDDMEGADYFLEDVPWVMYFYQGYGFHGVWWHANWGHPMSHGCVNQPNDMAEWLFGFADVGTLVNVHE
ncbi:MAG: L,D-transpeptidase family protein [Anaerolineae bacterium]|nr:L,D-transpeptidase family protein [Anaerolineae bacterium]